MCTSQKYDEGAIAQSANESTVENQAPVVDIPANLHDEGNWELAEIIELTQCPAVTSLKPGLVLAAINAAYRLGTQQASYAPQNSITVSLSVKQHTQSSCPLSAVEIVNTALTNYRTLLIELGDNDLDLVSRVDDLQDQLLGKLSAFTTQLLG